MTTATRPTEDLLTLQCMEVWGGNEANDSRVSLSGLDAWVFSRPFAGEAHGGDVHYVSSCASGRISRLLVADVSGHGEAVAAIAVGLRTLLRRYVNHIDQTRFVESMNEALSRTFADGGFATSVISTYFGPTRTLSVSNAGHPPPLWYRAKTGVWQALTFEAFGRPADAETDATGDGGVRDLPLGIVGPTRYTRVDVRIDPMDLVVFYTDSLIEAADHDGRQIGVDGLLELVRGLEDGDPDALIPALLARVDVHREGRDAGDDVTVLLIRPNGRKPVRPLIDRLLLPWHMGKAFVASLRPGGPPMPWPEFSLAAMGGFFSDRLSRR
ncbi:MAG: serine/threonine-protein phosphatase [Phycisphaerales bacterium]|nr:serine/threonine-protein phosphatase [Phycisphaerales bacterium]